MRKLVQSFSAAKSDRRRALEQGGEVRRFSVVRNGLRPQLRDFPVEIQQEIRHRQEQRSGGIREDDEVLLYVGRIHNTFNFSFELRRKDDNGVHVVVQKKPSEPLPLQLEEIFKKMIRENLESQKIASSEESVARWTEETLVQTRIRVRRSIAEFVEAHPPPPGERRSRLCYCRSLGLV